MDSIQQLDNVKGQKYIFHNIRSIYNDLNELRLIYANSNFICIGFVETWLNSMIPTSMISIEGYNVIRQDRTIDKRGGGLLMYIRNDIEWKLLGSDSDCSNANIEILNVVIKLTGQKKTCVSCAYLPPKGDIKDGILHLEKVTDIVLLEGYDFLLGGDFNVNLANSGMEKGNYRWKILQISSHSIRLLKIKLD